MLAPNAAAGNCRTMEGRASRPFCQAQRPLPGPSRKINGNPAPATPYDDLNLRKEAPKCTLRNAVEINPPLLSNLQVIKSLHGKNTY